MGRSEFSKLANRKILYTVVGDQVIGGVRGYQGEGEVEYNKRSQQGNEQEGGRQLKKLEEFFFVLCGRPSTVLRKLMLFILVVQRSISRLERNCKKVRVTYS